jgi:integrase
LIEKRKLKGGKSVYRVRWREAGRGSKERVRTFDRKEDAARFETEMRRQKQLGGLATSGTQETLDEWARQWFRSYAQPTLARTTLTYYAHAWDKYVLPRLGGQELRRITPQVVSAFADELRRDGVGEATIRKVLSLLQGVFQRAVVLGHVTSNPVAPIRKPVQRRKRAIRPLAPAAIEALRSCMPTERDAVLVSVLAYAGLRPGEALALKWGNIGERTILVERSLALGELKATKTYTTRSVRLLAPLRADLKAFRLRQGRPTDEELVFSRARGEPWRDTDWRNWRRRVFGPAALRAGGSVTRPYDLRHSYVSLLIAEGRTIVDVATQAGHSATVCLNTYAHVFAELEDAEKRRAEDMIAEARATSVRPAITTEAEAEREEPASNVEPTPGLEPGTPSLRVKCSTS